MLSSNYNLQQIRTGLSKNRELLFWWKIFKRTAEQTKDYSGLNGNYSSCLIWKALLIPNKKNSDSLMPRNWIYLNAPLGMEKLGWVFRRKSGKNKNKNNSENFLSRQRENLWPAKLFKGPMDLLYISRDFSYEGGGEYTYKISPTLKLVTLSDDL